MPDRPTVSRELLATVPIALVGGVLHFAFEWAGGWPPLAVFAAVNESVWEHLKIAFWPAAAWALGEAAVLRCGGAAFWGARGVGLFAIPLLIALVFYAYTAVLGHHVLGIDLALFVAAIAAGQTLSAALIGAARASRAVRVAGCALLVVQLAAFASLTYAPPDLVLFDAPSASAWTLSAK
ncbi:hypothetical protein SAMN05216241_11327 [Limimonas halophila]|uniref:Uncharacterized protein n=2 Tax=Limimonas halophila TaxID=1082479 RepID=A0A1G7UB22_9PROT|nr:hypothetical protein SAMN05216241_11327 [Limimonas halophila]